MAHDLAKWCRFLGLMVQGDIGPMTTYTSQRGKTVAFPRAPPLNPPTPAQETIRDNFRNSATQWRALTTAQREDWRRLAATANLGVTGYNLFTWYYCLRRTDSLSNLERKTGITVQRPP